MRRSVWASPGTVWGLSRRSEPARSRLDDWGGLAMSHGARAVTLPGLSNMHRSHLRTARAVTLPGLPGLPGLRS